MASLGGATTDFTPGGTMRTRVSAGNQLDALGGGDDYDPYQFIKDLRRDKENARREGLEYDDRRAQKLDFRENALSSRADPNANLKEAAEREALLANIAESKTAYQPAPTKMLFGAGIIPGRVAETTGLSGAQRRAYLPQNATMVGRPGESPARPSGPDPLSQGEAARRRFFGASAQQQQEALV